jgi:hypothetical protein
MNCTTCDAPLEQGALFCANCGARVATASSAATPTIALPGSPPQPAAPAAPPQYTYPPQSYGDQAGAPAARQPRVPPRMSYMPVWPACRNAAG